MNLHECPQCGREYEYAEAGGSFSTAEDVCVVAEHELPERYYPAAGDWVVFSHETDD